jgi:hypothetical protein
VLIVLHSAPGLRLAHDPAIVGQPPGKSLPVRPFKQRDHSGSGR